MTDPNNEFFKKAPPTGEVEALRPKFEQRLDMDKFLGLSDDEDDSPSPQSWINTDDERESDDDGEGLGHRVKLPLPDSPASATADRSSWLEKMTRQAGEKSEILAEKGYTEDSDDDELPLWITSMFQSRFDVAEKDRGRCRGDDEDEEEEEMSCESAVDIFPDMEEFWANNLDSGSGVTKSKGPYGNSSIARSISSSFLSDKSFEWNYPRLRRINPEENLRMLVLRENASSESVYSQGMVSLHEESEVGHIVDFAEENDETTDTKEETIQEHEEEKKQEHIAKQQATAPSGDLNTLSTQTYEKQSEHLEHYCIIAGHLWKRLHSPLKRKIIFSRGVKCDRCGTRHSRQDTWECELQICQVQVCGWCKEEWDIQKDEIVFEGWELDD